MAAFKHLVHDARATMQEVFERRCTPVSKAGACWRCSELAGFFRGAEERERQAAAPELQPGMAWSLRLEVVRNHDPEAGVGRALHAFLARQLRRATGYD